MTQFLQDEEEDFVKLLMDKSLREAQQEIKELTPTIVNELIEKIVVSQAQGTGRVWRWSISHGKPGNENRSNLSVTPIHGMFSIVMNTRHGADNRT
ncbi:DUF4368 domain-containing protein [Clostridium ljungdahlii]|uniref:DUF4368 domain-containing protein n=1 Tax=Clostridium ljungdahlii TaxID=1538 RepID=UPI0009EE9258|nr:DUF4368 domain-containing protein [Clostridium ljungdahlii]